MPSAPEPQARITTKHGDDGTTGLLFGGRVSKADPRVEAYGVVDEAISALGLARATTQDGHTRTIIEGLQRHLFTVGAELATAPGFRQQFQQAFGVVTPAMTAELDEQLEALQAEIDLPREFVVPGDSPASAAMDVGRSVLRRAERQAVGLQDAGLLDGEELVRFLNRAGDLAFVLARHLDRHLPYNRVRR
jgi:cob(I)alamin adenosyltransferase